jgi:hypothetical protein
MDYKYFFTTSTISGIITVLMLALGAYDKILDTRKKRIEVKKLEDEYNTSKKRKK